MIVAQAGHYRFPQYKPQDFHLGAPLIPSGSVNPKIAAMMAMGPMTEFKDPVTGQFLSPADPRVGIVPVNSKETVEHYRGIRIMQMPSGGFVTDKMFPGDRRMVTMGRHRLSESPLYDQTLPGMRSQIDNALAPLDGLGEAAQTKDRLLFLGIGFALGAAAIIMARRK